MLDDQVGDGDSRQIEFQRHPRRGVVPRKEQTAFPAEIEQTLTLWVLADDMQIADLRQSLTQVLPGRAEIARPEQVRPAIVELVGIHDDIGGGRVER